MHHSKKIRKFQIGGNIVLNRLCVTVVLISQLSAANAMEPDAKLGKRIFDMRCAMCHVAEKDAGNATGPNLHGIVGRGVGKADRFAYSEAMLKKTSEAWTPERLDRFLGAPQSAYVSGFKHGCGPTGVDCVLADAEVANRSYPSPGVAERRTQAPTYQNRDIWFHVYAVSSFTGCHYYG